MDSIQQVQLIVSAARAGRVSARGALGWAQRAAAGEDISVLARLESGCERLGEPDASRLTNSVVSILAGSATADTGEYDDLYPVTAAAATGDDAEEYDALYPAPGSRRTHAAASAPADLDEADVYELLFGSD